MTTTAIEFVGAGPGAADLITVRGKQLLASADVVVYAGSLVPETVLTWMQERAERHNSASMDLDTLVSIMADAYRAGKRVVRLHTGDPSLYGAIFEQMRRLDEAQIPYRVTPGVTAAFAAAAALQMEYTVPETSQSLILTRMAGRTPVPETESLSSLAAHRTAMAIYLSMGQVEEVARVLTAAYGADASCAITYRVSHPDERLVCCRVDELADTARAEKITKHALILIGSALDVRQGDDTSRSRLYHETFSHGYRRGREDGSQ